MGRRVFVSFLGTGFYEKCAYRGKTCVTETRFVQRAVLSDINAKEWSSDDVAYILLTERAKASNWLPEDNRRESRNGNCVEYVGLYDELKEMGLPCQIEGVMVDEGGNEEQIWSVFSTVYGLLREGDALYFDLTHAFRYLPMLVLVLSNYSKYLKKTRVESMSYGNYEARSYVTGEAPIVDLMPLIELQEWTYAAAAFTRTGKVGSLVSFLREHSVGKEVYVQMADGLDEFEKEIETCRGMQIIEGKAVNCKVIPAMKKTKKIAPIPLKEILYEVNKEVRVFKRDDPNNVCNAIRWCKRFDLYQQAYTLCQEGVITKVFNDTVDLCPYDLKVELTLYSWTGSTIFHSHRLNGDCAPAAGANPAKFFIVRHDAPTRIMCSLYSFGLRPPRPIWILFSL